MDTGSMTRGKALTDEDINRLKSLYKEGMPLIQICAQMGSHRETVRLWLNKLGLRKPLRNMKQVCPWEAEAIALYKGGMNCQQIGYKIGKDGSTVRSRLRTIGIWTPPQRLKAKTRDAKYDSANYQRPDNEKREDLPLRLCRGVLCNGQYKFKPESRYVFRCYRCREATRSLE